MIEGRLKYEQWEDKEGKKRSTLRVVVENFQFVGAPGGGGNGGGGDGGSQGNWSRGQGGESREPIHEPEHAGGSPDDIPF
jgi:single-strand DNA-binding protein